MFEIVFEVLVLNFKKTKAFDKLDLKLIFVYLGDLQCLLALLESSYLSLKYLDSLGVATVLCQERLKVPLPLLHCLDNTELVSEVSDIFIQPPSVIHDSLTVVLGEGINI